MGGWGGEEWAFKWAESAIQTKKKPWGKKRKAKATQSFFLCFLLLEEKKKRGASATSRGEQGKKRAFLNFSLRRRKRDGLLFQSSKGMRI